MILLIIYIANDSISNESAKCSTNIHGKFKRLTNNYINIKFISNKLFIISNPSNINITQLFVNKFVVNLIWNLFICSIVNLLYYQSVFVLNM